MAPELGRKDGQPNEEAAPRNDERGTATNTNTTTTTTAATTTMAEESASLSGETLSSHGDAPHNMVVDLRGHASSKSGKASRLKKLFRPTRRAKSRDPRTGPNPLTSSAILVAAAAGELAELTHHADNLSSSRDDDPDDLRRPHDGHHRYPNPHGFRHRTPEEQANISAILASGVTIKDRKHHLKSYKQCFVGREAVDFLLNNGFASSRAEGVYLGNVLERELGTIEHVCGDHDFKDENLFYRFVRPKSGQGGAFNRKGSTEGNANLNHVGVPHDDDAEEEEEEDEPEQGDGTDEVQDRFAAALAAEHAQDDPQPGGGGSYAPSNVHNQQRTSSVTLSLGDNLSEVGAGGTPNTRFQPFDRKSTANTSFSGGGTAANQRTNHALIRMDKYGFLLEDDRCSVRSASSSRVPRASDALDTMHRIKKWEEMLSAGQLGKAGSDNHAASSSAFGNLPVTAANFISTQSKVKYYTRRGLPDTMRPRAWTVLTGVDIIMGEREGEYEELVARAAEEYEALAREGGGAETRAVPNRRGSADTAGTDGAKSEGNTVLETIERDIHRTFPKHYLFHNGLDDYNYDDDGEGDEDDTEEEGIEQILDSDDEDDVDNSEHDSIDIDDLDEEGGAEETRKKKSQQEAVLTEAKKQLFNDMIGRSNYAMSMMNINDPDSNRSLGNESTSKADSRGPGGDEDQTTTSSSQGTSKELGHGQAALRRVLRAYSMYDTEVGYCQGMNFIAAMFLTFLSEEEAFWLLVVVMNEEPYKLRELFGEDMAGTHEVLYIAEKLIQQFLPKLSAHMEKENIHISMFVTQWLLTIYTSTFPFELVSRVWDCFLVEGWKVVYRVMLALLDFASKDLLKLGFEQILTYFRDFPTKVDGGVIMNGSLKIALKRKHIQKHVNEWRRSNAAYETRSKSTGKMPRRHSGESSASSTLNSTSQAGMMMSRNKLAIAKGLLKKTKEIKVQDLSHTLLPIIGSEKFALVLHNVFTPEECSDIIDRTEEKGYENAHIYNGKTHETLRNCTRSVLNDNIMAENWFERIMHALNGTEFEEKLQGATWVKRSKGGNPLEAVGLNEMLRVLKYSPGQYFSPHNDTRFVRGKDQGDRAGETSHVSVYVYLNEKFKGGNLRFTSGSRYYDIVPKTGMVVLFDHNILHEGCNVSKGIKYVARTDVMYSDKAESFTVSVAGTGFTQEL